MAFWRPGFEADGSAVKASAALAERSRVASATLGTADIKVRPTTDGKDTEVRGCVEGAFTPSVAVTGSASAEGVDRRGGAEMDGWIRYEIVMGLQAEARERAHEERLARVANEQLKGQRSVRSAIRLVLRLPVPA